jgi:hypothetical protein
VVERGQDFGFALEAGESLGVLCESGREGFDGYIAAKLRVPGT